MTNTVPSPEDARKAALARREAEQTKQNEELLRERSELYGEAQLKIEDLMAQLDVDDISVLRSVIDLLDGQTVAVTSAPVLSAEEQELLEVFRSGRLERTDKGAYRDKEWSKLHPRQPKAPVKDETDDKDEAPAAPKKKVEPEPKKAADAPVEPAEPEEPKSFIERALLAGRKAVENAKK